MEALTQTFRFKRKDGTSSTFYRAVGAVGVLIILTLLWLSADPEAHERLHHDAGHEDHHCPITDYALGEAFYIAPVLVVPPPVVEFEEAFILPRSIRAQSASYTLLPSCGPPVAQVNA